MRRSLLAAGLLWVASAAVAGAAPQRTGLGTVGGQVLGLDGKTIEGARVTLQASDGSRLETTETNTQGRFWFPMLPTGQYDVRAHFKGRSSEWRKNVWVEVGRQTNVTLRLRPRRRAPSNIPSSLAVP